MLEELLLKLLEKRNVGVKELVEELGVSESIIKRVVSEYRDVLSLTDDNRIIVVEPIKLADQLIRRGLSFKKVARWLSWKDFEELSAKILAAHNYRVIRNLLMTKPVRLEIDVVGIDPGSGRGIFIDCKHWTRGVSRSALMEIADKQRTRVIKLLKYLSWVKPRYRLLGYLRKAYPVIITLTTPRLRVYNGVLIASIQELNQVLIDFDIVVDIYNVQPLMIGGENT